MPAEPDGELLACWGFRSERIPPRPIPDLPDALEETAEAWEAKANLPSRWPANERRFLRRCRAEFAETFAKVPPWPDVYGDRRLLRILRMDPARDEDAAVAKVAKHVDRAEAISSVSESTSSRGIAFISSNFEQNRSR